MYLQSRTLRKKICQSADKELMQVFMKVLVSSTNSADEAPLVTLGEIFVCQPELVESSISKLQNFQQKTMISHLEFGFLNAVSGEEINYVELHERLALMKKEIKQSQEKKKKLSSKM